MKTKEQLEEALALAIKECERCAIPAHMVRNCPSDLQARDQAWRKRQDLEFQLRELEKAK